MRSNKDRYQWAHHKIMVVATFKYEFLVQQKITQIWIVSQLTGF